MVDVNHDAKAGSRRVEVLTEPGRRRRWSAEEKARIVAETLVASACVVGGGTALADFTATGVRMAPAGADGYVGGVGGADDVFAVAGIRAACYGSGTGAES